MINEEQKSLEIELEAEIGGDKDSMETALEILAQFSGISSGIANHYKDKMENNPFSPDDMLGFLLWQNISKTNATLGYAIAQSEPTLLLEFKDLIDGFLERHKDGWDEKKNRKNKKEEKTFYKENRSTH